MVRAPGEMLDETLAWLRGSSDERFCYLLARASRFADPWEGPTVVLRVTRPILVPSSALTIQTPVRVEVNADFTREILVKCYEYGLSLIDLHTHPFSDESVAFSGHDLQNMEVTHEEFRRGIPQDPPAVAASFVVGTKSVAGRWLDPESGALRPVDRLIAIGRRQHMVRLCA